MARKGSMFGGLRQFDGYAKTLDDFRVKTTTGATVTLISALIIFTLICSELQAYNTPTWRPSLVVDKSRKYKLPINFDITLHQMPCHMLSVDVTDDSGEHSIAGFEQGVIKTRLDLQGKPLEVGETVKLGDDTKDASKALATKEECGSCYGAKPLREDGCCHSCQDVREAYVRMNWGKVDVKNVDQCVREGWLDKFENQVEEGCNIKGKLMVNKVRGSLRIAPANIFLSSVMTFEDLRRFLLNPVDEESFNLSHTIHKLKFGPDTANEPKAISAVTNVLGETEKKTTQGGMIYQYFLKIVSTELKPLTDIPTLTNQYSVSQSERKSQPNTDKKPGVFFQLDISPMHIIYRESRVSFTSFFTGVLAIVGGIFTVAGLVDRAVYSAERAYKRKVQIGKTL